MPDFSSNAGADAAEQLDQEARAARAGARRYRMNQLVVKNGFAGLFRPLIGRDDLQTIETHQFMPTKDKPEEWSGDNWPTMMWAVCRRSRIFRLRDEQGNPTDAFEEGYGDCYLCSTYTGVKDEKFSFDKGKPSAITYGVAVMRDERTNGSGAAIGLVDKMVEYKDKDGTTHQIPEFVIIAQRWGNVWGAVANTLYLNGAMAQERDYSLTRADKEWKVGLVNIDPEHKPGAPSWDAYTNALKLVGFGDGDPAKGLQDYILAHATLDHYRTWFIPGEEPEGGYGRGKSDDTDEDKGAAGGSTEATPTAPGVDQSALEGFRANLTGRAGKN